MLNVLYKHHFQEKYIFVVYSQVDKGRPLKKFIIHWFSFTILIYSYSKLKYEHKLP